MAQQVFEYKGKFDVSDIVSSLKTLRAELGKSVTSESGGKMLSGIDKQFEKIAQDVIKMQSSLEKGFSSTSEVKAFEKELNKMYDSLLQIKNNMANIANTEIKINTKGAKKEFEDLEKEIKKIKDQALKDLLKTIDESVAKDKVLLKSRAKTGELTKESLQSEIDKREENIKKEQEEIQVLKDKYKQEKENKALEDALRQANSRNITTKTKLEENFSLIPRRGSTDPRMRAQGLREGTYSQSEFNDSAAKEINRLYKESLKEAFQSSQDVTSAIDIFKNKLAEFGVELKVTKDLQSAFSFAMEAMATKYDEGIKKVDSLTEAERNSIKTHSKKIEAFEEENNSLNSIIVGLNNYESEIANANAKLANFSSTADKNNDALEQTALDLNKITPSVQDWGNASRDTTNEIKETISYQEKMNQSFDNIKAAAINLLSIGNIYYIIRQEVTKTYEDIKSLDQAFGQIAMVTDFTLQDMWNKYDAYAQIANEMGQTTLSVVQASGLYFQQGLDEAEALELTASTMKLATLAGLDFEQATSLMTSAVRGFHMEMSEGEHVTDVYSELAANAAASVDGIATAMSRTAAIASSAGMEFETTAAMLTTMIEATQESPETLGTAMKTVIARFTELKENVSQVDSEFEDLDYNKVDKALKSIGVALKDTNGQFRDIDDVFLEVADKWDTLDRNTQRYIATIAAGSRQQSRFIALMENSARVHELLETAQNSAGRSTEQFAKYADTLENKVNRLKNSWEQFKISIIDSEFITGGVDLLNSLVSKMSKVDKGTLLSISAIGVILGKKLIEGMSGSLKAQNGLLTKSWGVLVEKVTKSKNNVLADKYSSQWEGLVEEEKEINKELEKQVEIEKKAQIELEKAIAGRERLQGEIEEDNALLNKGENIESERVKNIKSRIEAMEGEKKNIEEEIALAEERLRVEQSTTAEINERKNKNSKAQEKTYNNLESVTNPGSEADEKRRVNSVVASFVGSAISSALLAGITTFFTTKDATEALKVAGITIGTTLAPVAIEALMTKAVGAIAGSGFATSIATALGPVVAAAAPVLIGLAVAALVAGAVALVAWYNSEEQKLKRKGIELKKELEEAQKNASKREEKFNKADEEYKSLDKLYSKYKELNEITYKTTEQEEEYQSILEQIKEEYPDMVKVVNEETGEIEIQNKLLDEKLKKLKEEQQLQAGKLYYASDRVTTGERNKTLNDIDKEELDIKDLQNKRENLSIAGYSADYITETMVKWKDKDYSNSIISNILGIDIKDVMLDREKYLAKAKDKIKAQAEIINDIDDEIKEMLDSTTENRQKAYEDAAKEEQQNYTDYINSIANDEDVSKYLESAYKPLDIKYEARQRQMSEDDFMELIGAGNIENIRRNINDLGKETKEALKAGLGGISDKELEVEFSGTVDEEKLWEAYKNGLVTVIAKEYGEKRYNDLTNEQKEALHNFMQNVSSYSIKELNDMNMSELALGNVDLAEYFTNQIEEQKEKLNNIMSGKDEEYQLDIFKFLGIDLESKDYNKILDTWSVETAQAISESLQKIIDSTGDEKQAQEYANNLKKLFTDNNIDLSQMGLVLNTIDWSKATPLNFDNFREDSIEQLKELGISGAEAFFDEWAEQAKKYSLFTSALSNADIGGVQEQFDAETESIKGIISELNTWIKDAGVGGFVETNDIDKIKELGSALGVDVSGMYELDKATGKWKVNVRDVYDLALNNSKQYLKAIDDSIAYYEKLNETATPEDKEQNNIHIEGLKALRKEIEETQNSIDAQIDDFSDLTNSINNFNSNLSTLISTYNTLNKEQIENGHVSADSISSLEETLKSINAIAKDFKNFNTLNATDFLEQQGDSIVFVQGKMENYIDELIKAAERTFDFGKACDVLSYYQLVALKESFHETAKQIEEDNKEKIQSAYEEWQEALDKVREKQEAVAEAEEEVIEKEEELIEKQEELQKIYYGEENHKNQNDYLYNYNIELEQLEQNAKKAKEALDNLKPGDDVHQKVQDYVAALREEVTNYKAQNEVIKQYMENQKRMLDEGLSQRLEQLKAEGAVDTSTNVSDFYYERNGRFYIDYSKLNAAKLPDDVSDFIEQQVENLNKYSKAYEDNLDKIETAQKEFLDWQKAARDKQIATENKVIEILKKKDQEELDNLKDKYEGMKAADDDYTSALEESIKKQRDLRNQASQWDDLAEKEKKLSLQQRDTSGANAKEIKKTQEDIAKTRESLLDSAVDNIINNLKELYEEQEETRQAEIEYRQAILDNKNYVDEATAIINNWGSVEEAKAWFMKFDEEFINASDATIAKLLEDYEGYYNNTVEYTEAMGISYEDIINQTSEEIEEKVRETSETLTGESERALDETMDKVHEAQEKGREEVEEAKKAVEDAKNKVVEATRAVAEALEEAKKKQEEYNEAIRNQKIPTYEPPEKEPPEWSAKDFVDEKIDYIEKYYDMQKGKVINDNYNGNYILGVENQEQLKQVLKELGTRGFHSLYNENSGRISFGAGKVEDLPPSERSGNWTAFATGGLVNYTGPAWVDGTPSKPEAFLSASDTEMIREFIDLQKLTFTRPSTDSFTRTNNYGDPVFNIDINVDSISSDYDVDRLVERVHEDILSITSAPGQSVILSK